MLGTALPSLCGEFWEHLSPTCSGKGFFLLALSAQQPCEAGRDHTQWSLLGPSATLSPLHHTSQAPANWLGETKVPQISSGIGLSGISGRQIPRWQKFIKSCMACRKVDKRSFLPSPSHNTRTPGHPVKLNVERFRKDKERPSSRTTLTATAGRDGQLGWL